MRYQILHKTDYRYASGVAQSHHLVHLSPRRIQGQTIDFHEVIIAPPPAQRREFRDYFGNPTIHLTLEEDHTLLSIEAISRILVERDHSKALGRSKTSWDAVRDALKEPANAAEAEFSCYSTYSRPFAALYDYALRSFAPGRPLLDAVMELTSRIYEDFDYDSAATDISTPVDKVFEMRGGVCQDFAHLQLTCLRMLGLSARYVSGYLRTYPPEGQLRLVGADASHAWISVWSPDEGWIDFDPTNNKMIADEHVTLSVGRDFADVSPISGVILGGGNHMIDVSVDVMPINEDGIEILPDGSLASLAQQTAPQVAGANSAQVQGQSQNQNQNLGQNQVQTQSPSQASGQASGQTSNQPPASAPTLATQGEQMSPSSTRASQAPARGRMREQSQDQHQQQSLDALEPDCLEPVTSLAAFKPDRTY